MIFGASTLVLNSVLVANLLQNLRKRKRLKSHEDKTPPPLLAGLTLAMPLRNESKNLRELLPLLEEQVSLPEKILFYDDESSDNTLTLLRDFQSKQNEKLSHQRIEILRGLPPPAEYYGKAWALKQLLEKVTTEFVLFVDADVRFSHPRALFSLYEECAPLRKAQYSLASVSPRSTATQDVSLLVNQVFVHLYYATRTTGSKQLLYVNAQKLKDYNFLDKISQSTSVGSQLAQLFKEKESHVDHVDGGAFFQSNFYSDFFGAFKSFSRQSYDSDLSIKVALITSALLFWSFVLPFILLPFAILNPCWLAALAVILWGQYRLMQELNLNPLFVATTPLAASLSCVVHLWSALKNKLELKEEWRGRLLT